MDCAPTQILFASICLFMQLPKGVRVQRMKLVALYNLWGMDKLSLIWQQLDLFWVSKPIYNFHLINSVTLSLNYPDLKI